MAENVKLSRFELPPSLHRKRKGRGKLRRNVDSCDEDDELPLEITATLRKIPKLQTCHISATNTLLDKHQYDAHNENPETERAESATSEQDFNFDNYSSDFSNFD